MKAIKKYFTQKPWKIASDAVFLVLILALLIPGPRGVILAGVAKVRSWMLPLEANDGQTLTAEDWDWTLTDLEGRVYSFSDFKGKTILLNQWATWCPPCRAELPSIQKLYRNVGSDVSFILLTNEDSEKVRDFLRKHGFTFPVYIGAIRGKALLSRTIPLTSLLDSDGKIRVQKAGAYNWNSRKVRKLVRSLSGAVS